MIKYDHFTCDSAEGVTATLEKYEIQPQQIVSITNKVIGASTYRYEYTGSLNIDVDTFYTVFYWYNTDEE
jgi:hypothetical protein